MPSFINYFWRAPQKRQDLEQPDPIFLEPVPEQDLDAWARVNDEDGAKLLRPLFITDV